MGNGLCLATVIDSTRESCMLRANFATSWPGDVRAVIHSRAPLATIVYSIDTADLDFGTSRVRESTQLEAPGAVEPPHKFFLRTTRSTRRLESKAQ